MTTATLTQNAPAAPRGGVGRVLSLLRRVTVAALNLYLLGLLIYLLLRLLVSPEQWWIAFLNNFTPWYFLPLIAVLPLSLLLRARWTAARALPFALIGLLWFGPLYLPPARADSAAGPTLRVLTHNLLANGRPYAPTIAWLDAQDVDLIVLQEVTPDFPPLADGDYVGWDESRRWWGSAVKSRYPVQTVERFVLGSTPQTRVVIDLAGQPVAVYAIHLSVPLRGTPHLALPAPFDRLLAYINQYYETGRNEEIRALLAHLEDEPYPYVLVGDFNMSDQAAIYAELDAQHRDAFREAGVGLGATWPLRYVDGRPINPPLVRIDYVWTSPHFRALDASLGAPTGSDHLPLYATLDLYRPDLTASYPSED